jgi:hypothetical protein
MPTPRGYVPTDTEKLAHRERQRRLRNARRADPASSLPLEARALACTLKRFSIRFEAHTLPRLDAIDAQLASDSLALAHNEINCLAQLLTPKSPRSRK